MAMKKWITLQAFLLFFFICRGFSQQNDLKYEKEVHFKNVRQLTFKGENAEAYWSFDDKSVVFQSTNPDWQAPCDQIFMFDLATDSPAAKPRLLSTGKGRTTCAYFMPGNTSVVYASTHKTSDMCPPVPERSAGRYVWPIYGSYDIYLSGLNGKVIRQLTKRKGYDAEATVSPKGDLIVFTSDRSGDLELYTMDLNGKNVKQVTFGLGYDGGAFFSPDGSKLVFRASRPKTDEEITDYKNLLAQGLVAPTNMEIYTCNVDGSDLKQVTQLGKANWAPFYHPSGRKIIFSSNHHSSRGFNFNLFMINEDGSGLEQISFDGVFDAFPMFSFDGKKIIFSSNRNNGGTKDTNIFVADWVE
jgi:TolB protein